MCKYKIIILALIFLTNCTSPQKNSRASTQDLDLFKNKSGCFLLYNLKTKSFEKSIGSACNERFPACSSFKVPLAVMAFDSGVLPDEKFVLKWNGVKDLLNEKSNRDHNAESWMRDSVVWFSQKITPQLGPKKFQKYLDDFEYGNRSFSQGIKTAWLTRPSLKGVGLEISSYEQVEFMRKLWTNSLPVSLRAMKLTQKITFLEVSPKGYTLSGKTGSNFYDENRKIHLGWFIGHLKNADSEYIVVTNFSDLQPTEEQGFGGLRAKELTKNTLQNLGLW